MTTPMLQLEARLQSSVRGRFPHWFRGRRRYLAAPLLRTVGRWSRLDLLDGFIKASGHLHGFAFVEAALEWVAQRRAVWNEAHQRVIEALHALARNGTELVYVPGNHDRPARRFCGLVLPRMRVRRRLIHVTADGRRLLVTHGDDYDAATQFGGLQEHVGDWLYYRILTGNQWFNRARRCLGLRYWSLAEFLKSRSGAAERYVARFVQAGFDDARRRCVDGIVCGHIHRAALFERDGRVYANDGDWVENLTALVEDPDGSLRLLAHTGETLACLPARPCTDDAIVRQVA